MFKYDEKIAIAGEATGAFDSETGIYDKEIDAIATGRYDSGAEYVDFVGNGAMIARVVSKSKKGSPLPGMGMAMAAWGIAKELGIEDKDSMIEYKAYGEDEKNKGIYFKKPIELKLVFSKEWYDVGKSSLTLISVHDSNGLSYKEKKTDDGIKNIDKCLERAKALEKTSLESIKAKEKLLSSDSGDSDDGDDIDW